MFLVRFHYFFSYNTALCKAVEVENAEIVKRILSFKNIDINYMIILKLII